MYFKQLTKAMCCGLFAIGATSTVAKAQGNPEYGRGLVLSLNEEGSKYIRLISLAQGSLDYTDGVDDKTSPMKLNLRRVRLVTIAQLNPQFLFFMHIGTNGMNAETISPTGLNGNSVLYLNDAYAQFNYTPQHSAGIGLHLWNGISRLNAQGVLNMVTLDNNRQSYPTLGLTEQGARHLGIFAKGKFERFRYAVSVNEALKNTIDNRDPNTQFATYNGYKILGSKKSGWNYSGYFEYQLLDQESNDIPYRVGSYVGTKRVLNIGAGMLRHPNGSVVMDNENNPEGQNVGIYGMDVFYDSPIGKKNGALTTYLQYQHADYGKNYLYNVYGTGGMIYGHVAYVIPSKSNFRLQPYVGYANLNYEAVDDHRTTLMVGANLLMRGQNSKLTLEYKNESFQAVKNKTVCLQATIWL